MPMPQIINNTLTANTPDEMWECVQYLLRCGRRVRDLMPVSLVYGYGGYGYGSADGGLRHIGDELDISPILADNIRLPRWWEKTRNDDTEQLYLPFSKRCTLTRIESGRNRADVSIRFIGDVRDFLTLSVRKRDRTPGPYTIRAIRIHNVSAGATVEEPQAQTSGDSSMWFSCDSVPSPIPARGDLRPVEDMPATMEQARARAIRRPAVVASEVNWLDAEVPGPCPRTRPRGPQPANECGQPPIDEEFPLPPEHAVAGRAPVVAAQSFGRFRTASEIRDDESCLCRDGSAPDPGRDCTEEEYQARDRVARRRESDRVARRRESDRITRIAESYGFVNYSDLRPPTTNNVRE